MKFALLSLAAGLALSTGTASAGPPGYGGYGGYGHGYRPAGGHLDYHHGHYHYHNGYYRSAPLVPAYPAYGGPVYGAPLYNSGFGLNVYRPGFNLSIGSGSVTPYYGYSSPYYGGGFRW